ncbi:neomycin resistance protein-like [Cricetulus griseus]|uniref:Neomycin resistance protein-like n=1 Tax=Cricetulus griseus TaxID=10029 RepID=A0A9J7GWF9_CRIGR|nr:neomycin resistance protein-like [Cricetulus griseus]XP_035298267.1 neomycin resistance protein-like [Cricetulus griseus]XP_035298268.1 neomycin resistance protein-like [Cricetulus griseus]XP_035314760.1 neomycin resistance protein-like [Cricetulus griseus]XP_035314761.1 neomycin resistance protein-like [Cricetulus griseus]XP_035314762.1 neomycin resistance protein-like [Cricetulus griseus]
MGSRRRQATARIRHHVTASQSIPSSEAHGGAAQQRKAERQQPERALGTRVATTRPPAQVSAGNPPRPLSKHALLTAPQQEQPARLLACAAQHWSQCQARAPAASSRSREPWPASAPRALLSGEDNREKAGTRTASQTPRIHPGVP